jgi:integrase
LHFLHHLQKVWILFKFGYLRKSKRLDFFRHSHASLLIHMGFPILAVSERPEHEKVQTTLELYGHLEYSCAVTPQVRQTGNRLSGPAGTAYASLLT